MIDYDNPTNFSRTTAELEEFLLFAILAANRDSRQAAKSLDDLLRSPHPRGPFARLQSDYLATPHETPVYVAQPTVEDSVRRLAAALRGSGMGLNRLKAQSIVAVVGSDDLVLADVTRERLRAFPGIGWKTSGFFLLHSCVNARCAALDVRILRHMREVWGIPTPAQTPTSRRAYDALERAFLAKADELGIHPARLDIDVWHADSIRQTAKKALDREVARRLTAQHFGKEKPWTKKAIARLS